MRSAIVVESGVPLRAKRAATLTLVVMLAVTALALLSCGASWFGSIRTTVEYGWGWIAAYLVVLTLLLSAAAVSRRATPAMPGVGRLKRAGRLLGGIAGAAMMSAFGIFSGAPVLLHLVTSVDGELTVTVAGKETDYRRRECNPRLVIKEFTFPIFDHICPDEETFRRIPVGSRVRLIGEISPFGISPERLVQVSGARAE